MCAQEYIMKLSNTGLYVLKIKRVCLNLSTQHPLSKNPKDNSKTVFSCACLCVCSKELCWDLKLETDETLKNKNAQALALRKLCKTGLEWKEH